MQIIVYDPDLRELRKLKKMIKKALPDYKYEFFTSEDEMMKYTENNDVQIIFLELDTAKSGDRTQCIVNAFRNLYGKIDFVITSNKELDNDMVFWCINTQISDYLHKPYTYERLIETLAHIWYNKIPEYDPTLKRK